MNAATGAVAALWWREIVRFVRQRSRLIGAVAQPFLFWLLLGGGFGASFQPQGTAAPLGALEYFYPGIIALVVLFTAIFSTIAVVEDRQSGFLQGVLVAPVGRATVVLGQALGATTLATIHGLPFLALAPLVGIPLGLLSAVTVILVTTAIAFALTNLGLAIAWRLDSTQGFHVIMNLMLMPLWLLSGAFFPAAGAAGWLAWIMSVNPLMYGVAALRRCLYTGAPAGIGHVPPLGLSIAVTILFCAVTYTGAVAAARRAS